VERGELDYTPAPDCFHDIFGHTPMIVHPRFADFYQKIGQAARACGDPGTMEGSPHLLFTVEFGLIRNPGGPRILRQRHHLLPCETLHSLTDKTSRSRTHRAAGTPSLRHSGTFRNTLFVIDGFDQLETEFDRLGAGSNRLLDSWSV